MLTVVYKTNDSGTEHSRVEVFNFNDGSCQVQLDPLAHVAKDDVVSITLVAHMKAIGDQMALIMTMGALRDMYKELPIDLYMPFTPYGRQDAVFVEGQANAMKVWADVVNMLEFRSVTTLDPHSIAVSHFDRCTAIDIVEILGRCTAIDRILSRGDITLVSPDAGANKKCHKIAKKYGLTKFVRADKARDLSTGTIIETEIYGDVKDEICVIIDDICDGGMTFIKLAEKLKAEGAAHVVLFVTHGLFTKGLAVFNGLIDQIHTTESCLPNIGLEDDYEGHFRIYDEGTICL